LRFSSFLRDGLWGRGAILSSSGGGGCCLTGSVLDKDLDVVEEEGSVLEKGGGFIGGSFESLVLVVVVVELVEVVELSSLDFDLVKLLSPPVPPPPFSSMFFEFVLNDGGEAALQPGIRGVI